MLIRRLYSSLPSTRAGTSHSAISSIPTSPKPQTRGRIKPRLTTSSCKTKSTSSTARNSFKTITAEKNGRGRRRSKSLMDVQEMNLVSDSNRYTIEPINIFDESNHHHQQQNFEDYSNSSVAPTSKQPSSPKLSFTHPKSKFSEENLNSFKPIYIYPEQFKLHYTFTHPSHPLPLNLGTSIYTNPRKSLSNLKLKESINNLFNDIPSSFSPNPVNSLKRLNKGSSNGLNEHYKIISNLSHPSLIHNLGGFNPWTQGYFGHYEGELSNKLITKLEEIKEISNKSNKQWENILSKLEGKNSNKIENNVQVKSVENNLEKDANLDEVVLGLDDVLSKLGLSSNTRGRKSMNNIDQEVGLSSEEGVLLDSVKRKRKKKISKHKYKKRRKATRALRKRLGK